MQHPRYTITKKQTRKACTALVYSSATPETHDNKKTEKESVNIPYNSATPETHETKNREGEHEHKIQQRNTRDAR